MAQQLLSAVTGDPLGAVVPVRDVPVPGDEVHAVGDLVEKPLVERLFHRSLPGGEFSTVTKIVSSEDFSRGHFLPFAGDGLLTA